MIEAERADTGGRKIPFETVIDFTVANLKEAVRLVREHGLKQVQFCCRTDSGLHAMVYASGKVVLFSRYCFRHRPQRIKLGELGLITVEQARRGHRVIRLQASQGQDPKTPKKPVVTYNDVHEHYVVQCRSRRKRSLKADESRHRNWLCPAFGEMPVADIDVTAVNRLIIRMQEAGLAPATIKNVVAQLGACLDLAVELDHVGKNVARSKFVRVPRVNNRRTEFLTVEQMARFMEHAEACTGGEFVGSRALMLTALAGSRIGETLGAKHADFDLEAGLWKLPHQKSGVPGVIHLSQRAVEVVAALQTVRRSDFLCPGARGNDQLSRPHKLFKRICERAGIKGNWRVHDLRHAWCSVAVYAGVPIEIVSHGARHSAPAVTRRYTHPHRESLASANAAVAALIYPTKG